MPPMAGERGLEEGCELANIPGLLTQGSGQAD